MVDISILVRHIGNSCLAWPPPNISPVGAKTSIVNVKAADQPFEAQILIKKWSCLEDFHTICLSEPILLSWTMSDMIVRRTAFAILWRWEIQSLNLFPHLTMQYISRWFLY